MAESGAFKTLNDKDIVSTRTLLHEAIPITGTIVSGTYGVGNIKTPAHGMFQSVYDYPYLSSSANHIFLCYSLDLIYLQKRLLMDIKYLIISKTLRVMI